MQGLIQEWWLVLPLPPDCVCPLVLWDVFLSFFNYLAPVLEVFHYTTVTQQPINYIAIGVSYIDVLSAVNHIT